MSIFKNDIQGNANISRNMNVGGHANVNGNAIINHNLVVKGWLDAPNVKGPLKGLYDSEESLAAAYPRPLPGWFALVGNTLPADVWRTEGGRWVPTGEKGGEFSLYPDRLESDVADLTDEVKDLEELLADGILLSETIAFTSTGSAASMTFTVLKRDGTTKQDSRPIPIATAEKAGMMTASDKTALAKATADITALKTTTDSLLASIEAETSERIEADAALDERLTTLRRDFDALVGENTSEAIDNFSEILRFLDGLKDTDKLSTKLADLSGADEKLGADVLELQNEVWPLTVAFNVEPAIIKAAEETPVRAEWTAKRKGRTVTADSEITLDGEKTVSSSLILPLTLGHGASRTFVLTVAYAGMNVTERRTVRGTHPTYFGTVDKTWTADEAGITAMAELITGERALTRTGIALNDGRIALAYPKDMGTLTSVKDGNGYEVLQSYIRSEVTVNGTPYYCYLLTVPVTASGVTQIYK